MKKKTAKKGSVRKNIDLPIQTATDLKVMATNGRMKTKPYIELVLIEHAKQKI